MDSKCPIEKLDESVKKGFQIDADTWANQNHSSGNERGKYHFENPLKSNPDQTVKQCADESWLKAFKKAAECSVEDLHTDEMAHLASIRCFYQHFGSIFKDWMGCFNENLSDKEKRIFEKFHQMTKDKNKDEL